MWAFIGNIIRKLRSPKGQNAGNFLIFLGIAALLWYVLSLNEETTIDMKCPVRITNIPDSVIRISPLPDAINISVKARGTDMFRYGITGAPIMNIDYTLAHTGESIIYNESAIKAYFRNLFGGNAQVITANPDSLNITFTSQRPVLKRVVFDGNITAAHQYIIIGTPQLLTDTVKVYSNKPIPTSLRVITTQPITISDLRTTTEVLVPLNIPAGMRAIPDSVRVKIDVEPLISKSLKARIEPVNVPLGVKLITLPSQVDVNYMVPMSVYKQNKTPKSFTVHADYNTIKRGSDKMKISLVNVPKEYANVFLQTDSVLYMIEQ